MTAPGLGARVGGIEAGGTKIVVGVGTGPDDIIARSVIPTTAPADVKRAIIQWFAGQPPITALGIASFGPLELDRAAPRWGHIVRTTKPGWSNVDLAPALGSALGVPTGFDTDVNGAALGEARWGAGVGCKTSLYVTVGTGIGGGAIVDGKPLHGYGHPEMGHMRLARHPDDTGFSGICPFHGDCCEGLVSGSAIVARFGASLSDLTPDHPAHAMAAFYLAQLVVNLQAVLAPERMILGGGVMKTAGLLDRVRTAASALGAGYFAALADAIIVPPALGDNSGLLGAFVLAADASESV